MAEHIEYQGNFSGSQIDTLLAKIQSSQVFTTEEKTKLASLVNYDDTEVKEDISGIETSLNSHKSDTTNPHQVTKAQVGLGNVDNTSDANKPISTATQAALDNKVNKVDGKGLSTNDFTDSEKAQISANKEGIGAVANAGAKNVLNVTATSSGIFTVNTDGTIKAQGTAGSSTTFIIVAIISASDAYKLNGMKLNGCPSGGESGGYRINLQLYGGDYTNYAIDRGDGAVISGIPQNPSYNLRLIAAVEAGKTVDIVFKPMIRPAAIEDDTYVPYGMTNAELTKAVEANKEGIGAVANRGSKNIVNNTAAASTENAGITWTKNVDGSMTGTGTCTGTSGVRVVGTSGSHSYASAIPIPRGTYVVAPTNSPRDNERFTLYLWTNSSATPTTTTIQRTAYTFTVDNDTTRYDFSAGFAGSGVTMNITLYPMICLKSFYDADSTYVPYAPTNRELYEMILALQSNS